MTALLAFNTPDGLLVVSYTCSTGILPDVDVVAINSIPVKHFNQEFVKYTETLVLDYLVDDLAYK